MIITLTLFEKKALCGPITNRSVAYDDAQMPLICCAEKGCQNFGGCGKKSRSMQVLMLLPMEPGGFPHPESFVSPLAAAGGVQQEGGVQKEGLPTPCRHPHCFTNYMTPKGNPF